MRRVRRRDLPRNPTPLSDFDDLPDQYTRTLAGENFLIHDSGAGDGRILVFATRRNLELLARSPLWFFDGTFEASPRIFVQIFTILGICTRAQGNNANVAENSESASPFVYAFSKFSHSE
ncbi:hypothetical protein QAD02_016765 [Eretmocerus hayati]|uniref:Uncharacterized protein n=1 Tax=Eretmocerus hayati TaxID=131215 RepID=A0ACC2PC05_9HYME|nr:hypothetical protein QAD02_016765 [Eretmocerus hayati]